MGRGARYHAGVKPACCNDCPACGCCHCADCSPDLNCGECDCGKPDEDIAYEAMEVMFSLHDALAGRPRFNLEPRREPCPHGKGRRAR